MAHASHARMYETPVIVHIKNRK